MTSAQATQATQEAKRQAGPQIAGPREGGGGESGGGGGGAYGGAYGGDSFVGHVQAISLWLNRQIMHALHRRGFAGLRLSFEPYVAFALAGNQGAHRGTHQGTKLSDVATQLKISRQAANRTANIIEAEGYLRRRSDCEDGRAKNISPTKRGLEMIRSGAEEAVKAQLRLSAIVGEPALREAAQTLSSIYRALNLLRLPSVYAASAARWGGSDAQRRTPLLAGILPRLSDYVRARQLKLTVERGHRGLKARHGQVLSSIGLNGARVGSMSRAHGVSKQAISATVGELMALGYLRQHADLLDARQAVVRLTPSGRALLEDSVACAEQIAGEFCALVGKRRFQRLDGALREICAALRLGDELGLPGQIGEWLSRAPRGSARGAERGRDDGWQTGEISLLAERLVERLGARDAKRLGELLAAG